MTERTQSTAPEETWFDFLGRVYQYHISFPRVDLAIDDRKPYLSIPDLIVRTKERLLSAKLRETDVHDSGEPKEEVLQSKGGSLYIGSLVTNGEMNIKQRQLYDDCIRVKKFGERGGNRIEKALLNLSEFCEYMGIGKTKPKNPAPSAKSMAPGFCA